MKNGYSIKWSDHALEELVEVITYLEDNWTEKELKNLSRKIEKTVFLISNNPELYPVIFKEKTIRRAVITKHNNLYYRKQNGEIEIISFFSNRKNPKRLNL